MSSQNTWKVDQIASVKGTIGLQPKQTWTIVEYANVVIEFCPGHEYLALSKNDMEYIP